MRRYGARLRDKAESDANATKIEANANSTSNRCDRRTIAACDIQRCNRPVFRRGWVNVDTDIAAQLCHGDRSPKREPTSASATDCQCDNRLIGICSDRCCVRRGHLTIKIDCNRRVNQVDRNRSTSSTTFEALSRHRNRQRTCHSGIIGTIIRRDRHFTTHVDIGCIIDRQHSAKRGFVHCSAARKA